MPNNDFTQLGLFSPALDVGEPEIGITPRHYVSASDNQLAENLELMATKMQEEIDYRNNSGSSQQPLTARRLRIATQMERDAHHLQNVQVALRAIACGLRTGNLNPSLRGLRTKAIVTQVYLGIREPESRLLAAGIQVSNLNAVQETLKELITEHFPSPSEDAVRKKRFRDLERQLALSNIRGYFPTPPPVFDLMLQYLDLKPGMLCLEPSAGSGHIADRLRSAGALVETVEINPTLSELLQLKNFPCEQVDFLQYHKTGFPRIAMNPPFDCDMAHVRHAFDVCLQPGGILVSIMSPGFTFGSKTKEREFLAWTQGHNALIETLPQKAFMTSDVPTGVSAVLVVLEK